MPSVSRIHAREHPRPHRPRQRRADLARDQRADREAERHRQADIAEVERRRMEGEAGVLEQGVEPPALRAAPGRAARTGWRRTAGRRRSRAPAPPARRGSRPACARRGGARTGRRPRRRRPARSPTAASSLRDCPTRRRICRATACRCGCSRRPAARSGRCAGTATISAAKASSVEQRPARSRPRGWCAIAPALRAAAPSASSKLQRRQRRGEPQRGEAGLGDHLLAAAAVRWCHLRRHVALVMLGEDIVGDERAAAPSGLRRRRRCLRGTGRG